MKAVFAAMLKEAENDGKNSQQAVPGVALQSGPQGAPQGTQARPPHTPQGEEAAALPARPEDQTVLVRKSRKAEIQAMIGPGDISDALEAIVDIATESAPDGSAIRLIDEMLIIRALNRFHGDQSKSGRWLGITRYAVRYRMEKYGLR